MNSAAGDLIANCDDKQHLQYIHHCRLCCRYHYDLLCVQYPFLQPRFDDFACNLNSKVKTFETFLQILSRTTSL